MAKAKNVIAPEAAQKEDAEEVTALTVQDDKKLDMSSLGNFEEYKNSIKKYVTKCKRIKLTETNLNEVKKVKSSLVSLRTNAAKVKKDWLDRNIKLRKTLAEAEFASVESLIADSEKAVDAQLDIYYNERKENLTAIYKAYIADINKTYAFDEESLENIMILERYFNTTIKEKEVYNDILSQFEEIKREKQEKKDAEEMIIRACKDTTLNAAIFIEKLQYKSAISVVNEIEAEKERLLSLQKAADEDNKAEDEYVDEEEVIAVHTKGAMSFALGSTASKTVTKRIEITYEESLGKELTKFFKSNNIKVKEV